MEFGRGWSWPRPEPSIPARSIRCPAIADVCRRHGVWLHVDGAYGGLFALCEKGGAKLRGIELADSVALDPHKTLFLPYGTGAALVRDGNQLLQGVQRHLPNTSGRWAKAKSGRRRPTCRPS